MQSSMVDYDPLCPQYPLVPAQTTDEVMVPMSDENDPSDQTIVGEPDPSDQTIVGEPDHEMPPIQDEDGTSGHTPGEPDCEMIDSVSTNIEEISTESDANQSVGLGRRTYNNSSDFFREDEPLCHLETVSKTTERSPPQSTMTVPPAPESEVEPILSQEIQQSQQHQQLEEAHLDEKIDEIVVDEDTPHTPTVSDHVFHIQK